jgi:hypothetical protein
VRFPPASLTLGRWDQARSRAEMCLRVMDRYSAVENNIAGKRTQMLTFIEHYLAKDDQELLQWIS